MDQTQGVHLDHQAESDEWDPWDAAHMQSSSTAELMARLEHVEDSARIEVGKLRIRLREIEEAVLGFLDVHGTAAPTAPAVSRLRNLVPPTN